MTRYLLHRPIAVCLITLALSVLGVLAVRQLPVSLLPDVPVPELSVQVSYPAASARELQRSIEQPLRNQLLQVAHLADLQSVVQDGQATLTLRFDYGTNVRLAFIETNEKIDGLLSRLPRDLERPRVIRAGAGDIPVFTLNVLPNGSGATTDFLALSEFCENVLKRRIEQLPDVALVDATGLALPEAVVQADPARLAALGLSESQLATLLKQANLPPGNLTVREGPYQYQIRFGSPLQTQADIEGLYLAVGGATGAAPSAKSDPRVGYFAQNVQRAGESQTTAPRRLIALRGVATVRIRERTVQGLYGFQAPGDPHLHRAVGLAIIKQSDAQLLHLRRELTALLDQFRADYPQLRFSISQDQTELLDLSISNLISNLLTGALLTIVMIFLFLRDRRLPLIIGMVLPVSLAITMLGFYVLGLSINIISLAGLVLGVGEIIDSAIIIIENIEEKRENGLSVADACLSGTDEVIRPLFTSVLTNSAVFLPLLLLSGLAGALFFDQAVSVSLALGVSLLCSYTLVPVLYHLLFRRETAEAVLPPTQFMRGLEWAYNRTFWAAFRSKWGLAGALVVLLAGAVWMGGRMGKQGMPTVSRSAAEVSIDWNEPLSASENNRQVAQLLQTLPTQPDYTAAFVGQQQFLLNGTADRRILQQTQNETGLYLQANSPATYTRLTTGLREQMARQFPGAVLQIRPGRNVFEQLFNTTEPPLRLKLYNPRSPDVIAPDLAGRLTDQIRAQGFTVEAVGQQEQLRVEVLTDRLLLYDVDEQTVLPLLKTLFNSNEVTTLQNGQRSVPLVLTGAEGNSNWQHAFVSNRQKQAIPLRSLLSVMPQTDYKAIYADKEGVFLPIDLVIDNDQADRARTEISALVGREPGVLAGWSGRYFRDQTYLTELGWVILVAIGLLFCILTAQFESLTQPFIVMLIIALGMAGAIWSLYIANDTLNVLSAIGMVVLIGLLDNDSILKIDTMNRGRETLTLMESIRLAGVRRLKSQVMTFLTTVLGLLPVLFSGGLGAELQRPLALVVIGGMCVGVLVSWTVIPVLYWVMEQGKTTNQNVKKAN
ncbi:MAG: efflux RND transporter permease subunit [Rudanella sp.]|nr:efflux RND transporter permease subunit [Rudanella sp.]